MARKIPEQTLLPTLKDDNRIVELTDVGTMIRRAETSLKPKALPTRVMEKLPDTGKLDAFKLTGLERLYESVKLECACWDPDETVAAKDRKDPATHLDTILLSVFKTLCDAMECPKRADEFHSHFRTKSQVPNQ